MKCMPVLTHSFFYDDGFYRKPESFGELLFSNKEIENPSVARVGTSALVINSSDTVKPSLLKSFTINNG